MESKKIAVPYQILYPCHLSTSGDKICERTLLKQKLNNIYYLVIPNLGETKMKMEKRKGGVGRIFEMGRRYRAAVVMGCILSAISAVLLMCPFVTVYYILEIILDSGGDVALMDTSKIVWYGWLSVILVVSGLLLNFTALMFTHYAAFRTMADIRYTLMEHLTRLPLGFHVRNPSGKIRKVIETNVSLTETYIAHVLPDMVASLISPIAILVIMMTFDWKLGLLCMVPMLIAFTAQATWMARGKSQRFLDEYQRSLGDMENSAVEYVRGISVVKVFGQTVHSFKTFYKSIIHYRDFVIRYTMSMRGMMIIFMILTNATFFVLVPAGIIWGQAATGGNFVLSFVFYVVFIPCTASALMKLLYMSSYTMQLTDAVTRIDAILAERPLELPKDPKRPEGNDIEFKGVRFTYDGNSEPALEGIDFIAAEGKVTALVGASGSGKTTIANLIPRFWDVDEGSVSIGGVDVRQMNVKNLMDTVGFVFQDTFLFKDSIRENIRIGNPSATDDDIMRAAELAQCMDIIEKLPNGMDTVIGTKGTYLSGGEQQRIALARAMLKNSPIVILDEATAFADPENEHNIQKALNELIRNKTVVMIAHRLSTIMNADKIIVLENGRMVEEGNHEALVSAGGRYSAMWQEYQRSTVWNIKEARA